MALRRFGDEMSGCVNEIDELDAAATIVCWFWTTKSANSQKLIGLGIPSLRLSEPGLAWLWLAGRLAGHFANNCLIDDACVFVESLLA